jgi:hypothetical protein
VAKGRESAAKGSRKVWIPLSIHEICTRKHDHNSVSRFCCGAEGRESAALIRAVLGNHNFEQLPCDDAPWGCGFKGLKSKTGRAGLLFSRISRYLHDRTCIYIYMYVFDGICTWYNVERTPRSRAHISALLACPCHTNLAPS